MLHSTSRKPVNISVASCLPNCETLLAPIRAAHMLYFTARPILEVFIAPPTGDPRSPLFTLLIGHKSHRLKCSAAATAPSMVLRGEGNPPHQVLHWFRHAVGRYQQDPHADKHEP
mmetsp:Transcript_70003/g.161929  ORF Transcript_70003/g.161929 Transcript_70003/m.161929 type:complete len:115 (-) Transcript_70003:1-345(-)